MALLSLQDVANASGLTPTFIRRLLNRLPEFFEKHLKRGVNNSIQVESNALGIFQHVSQLKADGLTIPQIKTELAAGGLTQGVKVFKPAYQTLSNPIKPNADAADRVGELMAELRETERKLHQERLERLQIEADFGKVKTLLLPEGKTPEQVAREKHDAEKRQAAAHARRLELLARLDSLPFWRWRSRRRLLTALHRIEEEGIGEWGIWGRPQKASSQPPMTIPRTNASFKESHPLLSQWLDPVNIAIVVLAIIGSGFLIWIYLEASL